MGQENLLADITDTARLVAFYRALELGRFDALFHDFFARRLAGPRGRRIAESMPASVAAASANNVRTFLFDRWIESQVAGGGVDTVLNLGAGFDVRPYRLSLPPNLRWIEVDLPKLIEEKEAKLSGARSACALERIGVNVEHAAERHDLFQHIAATSSRILVITEGVLDYLERDDVASLAAELFALPSFALWLSDLISPLALLWISAIWGRELEAAHSPKRFAPSEGPAFFGRHGWSLAGFRSIESESQRLNRSPASAGPVGFPGPWPTGSFQDWLTPYYSAVVLFKRDPEVFYKAEGSRSKASFLQGNLTRSFPHLSPLPTLPCS